MAQRLLHTRGLACLAGLLLSAPVSVLAAGSDADLARLMPLSLTELINTPIVTASRRQETRDQTPSHILVYTREQIAQRRYRNLADLLEDLPGVDFMRGTKSSAYNNFTVQGYTSPNKLLVMLDGVRIDNPAGGSYPLAENFALYMARQVEVLFGPAAALYGADAVAGVVNIITDQGSEGGVLRSASIGAGRFGSREGSFMTGFKDDEGFSLRLGGHSQQSDRAPLDRYYPVDYAPRDARTFAGALAVPAAQRENYAGAIASGSLYARVDQGQRFSLGYYHNRFRSLTSTGDRPETALYLDQAPWLTRTDNLFGRYRFDHRAGLTGELSVNYANQEVDPASRYVNIYTGFLDGYEYTRAERLSVEHNLNWQLDGGHQMLAGLGLQRYRAIEAHTLPNPYNTSLGPQQQGLSYRNTNLPVAIHGASHNNASAYIQLQSDWNPAFLTMAGLRVDHHSAYGQSTNPRFGAVWRPQPTQVFKLLYGEAFRAPSPEESLSSFGAFDGSKDANGLFKGTGFRVPNFNLAPEKSKTLSLTWDWRPRADLNLIANLYRSHIRNLIVTLPSTNLSAIPGATLIGPESKANAGAQWQQGLDLIGQWQFKTGESWSWDLWGSASWVRGRINDGDGVDWALPHVASHKLKIGASLRYLDRFSLSTQVLHTGDTANGRKKDRNRPPDRLLTPGYTVVNLHLGWHRLIDGKATLWLDITNLFDRRYYAAHGAGSRTFFDMPQQPRSWMASIEYPF